MYSFNSIRLYIPDGSVNPQLLSHHVLFSIGTLRVASRLGLCGPSEEREPLRGVGGGSNSQAERVRGVPKSLGYPQQLDGLYTYIYIYI